MDRLMKNKESVIILTPSRRLRRWVLLLREELLSLGIPTEIYALADSQKAEETYLERFERALNLSGKFAEWVFYPALTLDQANAQLGSCIFLDLTSSSNPKTLQGCIIRTLYNGCSSENALVARLWREPTVLEIELEEGNNRWIIQRAVVAIPDRELVVRALDSCFARLVSLCLDVISRLLMGKPVESRIYERPNSGRPVTRQGIWPHIRYGYGRKLSRQFKKPFVYTDDWAIAIRPRAHPAEDDLPIGITSIDDFQVIECPSDRFYADPFLFELEDDVFLFFEDFSYRENKAHISYVRVGSAGTSPVQLALSRSYHLSYPFIFKHGDAIFMIPETAENNAVELYEAVRFPDEWRLKSTLLNVRGTDTTLHWDERLQLWWMFVAESKFGSLWDTLSLFYSRTLDGPWQPHANNPVKYDARSSRPAGSLLQIGERLFRPTQDCSKDYGGSIVWCEVIELNPTSYHEEPVGGQTLSDVAYGGPHTFSRSRSYEALDLKRSRARFRSGS
jgi:hypothetical protein